MIIPNLLLCLLGVLSAVYLIFRAQKLQLQYEVFHKLSAT